MEIEFGNNIISSYQRLSYTPWHAFAEFVDNSTQAYFNNKEIMDEVFNKEKTSLQVYIQYNPSEDRIVVKDNSIGMSYEDLKNALIIGKRPQNDEGRSRYGLGMKTAACWFGDSWKVRTTKLGENTWHEVEVNVARISSGDKDLRHSEGMAGVDEHYTVIEITSLNREFRTKTIGKIKDFLRSMYRIDITDYRLCLYWQEERLTWDNIINGLYVTQEGEPYKKDFSFDVNGKNVYGWVGILAKGKASRRNAGFSIIQANRVIEGWPKGFKPHSVFGDQEDGRNDLINQRLVGELYLEGFAVSHTKDQIIWQDDEYDQIDEKLKEECKEAIYLAIHLRYNKNSETVEEDLVVYQEEAIQAITSELKSSEIKNYLYNTTPPPEKILEISYSRIENAVTVEQEPYIDIGIGEEPNDVRVKVFFNNTSEFEPYVLVELKVIENEVNIIINRLHPHYREMKTSDALLNFVRHCVYDGVSEWKAIKMIGEIKPNTVKFLKDGLLRLPFEIKSNKAESILGRN